MLGWKLNFETESQPHNKSTSLSKSRNKKRKIEEVEDNITSSSPSTPFSFEQVFGYCSHQGMVRTVSTPREGNKTGAVLASGGSDEYIKIYNIGLRREAGELSHHK